MRTLTYSLTASLDGYTMGPDGSFDWGAPDDEVFSYALDEVKGLSCHLMGRRLYETMSYWEDTDQEASWGDLEREFADVWRALPKLVFSTTLTEMAGNSRLAIGSLTDEVERLRKESDEGDLAIGGPNLAHQAATLGLIDEYRLRICPLLLGGGTTYFPHGQRREDLELVSTRVFDSGIVGVRYLVAR